MDEIKQDLRQIKRDVTDIKLTLAVNTESLVAHMARTKASEDRITVIENRMLASLGAALLALVGILTHFWSK